MKNFLVKEDAGRMYFAPVKILDKPSMINVIDNPIRMEIIRLLSKESLYPAEIAKKLKQHEQIIYYHIKQLLNAEIISVVEKKEIRGTIAKRLSVKNMNFAISLGEEWKSGKEFGMSLSSEIDKKLENFLEPIIKNSAFDAKIIVGSPDPHGPFKARARDNHYAIDLSLFLGRFVQTPKDFSVKLDVDINFPTENTNLILVGGPVANLIVSAVNENMSVRFDQDKTWEIASEKTQKRYAEEAVGLVAKLPNPHFPNRSMLILAGISSSGTKSAVLALTRQHKSLLGTYTGQSRWAAIVHGFDLDGDGKLDSVEILE